MLEMREVINLFESKTQLNEGPGAARSINCENLEIEGSFSGMTVREMMEKSKSTPLKVYGDLTLSNYYDAVNSNEAYDDNTVWFSLKDIVIDLSDEYDDIKETDKVVGLSFRHKGDSSSSDSDLSYGHGYLTPSVPTEIEIKYDIIVEVENEDGYYDTYEADAKAVNFTEEFGYLHSDLTNVDEEYNEDEDEEMEESINEDTGSDSLIKTILQQYNEIQGFSGSTIVAMFQEILEENIKDREVVRKIMTEYRDTEGFSGSTRYAMVQEILEEVLNEQPINEDTSKTESLYKNMYNFWKQNSLEKLFKWLKDSYGTDAENLMHGFMKHYSEDQELQNEFKKSSFIG